MIFDLSITGHVDLAKDRLIEVMKTEEVNVFGIVWLFRLFLILHYSIKDLAQWFEMLKEINIDEARSRGPEAELSHKLIEMMNLWAQENIAGAISALDEFITQPNFRDHPTFLWILTLKHLFKRAGEKDLTLIHELIELDPDNEYFYFINGAVNNSNRNYSEALQNFDRALAINPLYVDALISQASTLVAVNRRQDALQCFDRIAKMDSNDYRFLVTKAKLLLKLHLYDDILPLYDKIIELRPNVIQSYISKAQVYTRLGQFQDAMDTLNEAQKIVSSDNSSKDNEGLLLFQANLAFRLEFFEDSLMYYDKVIALNPGNYNAFILKGTVFEYLEDYMQAIECYDKAIELDPKNTQGFVSKGNALLHMKESEKAEQLYDKALAMDPKCQEALVSKGTFYYEEKENSRIAIEFLNKALDLDPLDNIPLIAKAQIYFDMGMFDQSIECYDKALQNDQTDYEVLHNRHLARRIVLTGEDKECQ
jgi:tetratricopeptide (TPR) repeat protein